MADKKYVSIFVPEKLRNEIKKEAQNNHRTIIGELEFLFTPLSCCGNTTASGGHQPHCPLLKKLRSFDCYGIKYIKVD